MSIDFDKFLGWAESRFDDVIVKGDEILINSIFCDDRKHHLWCNPSGGKTGCESGVYHCWKSDKSGSLVGLVMMVDRCPYEEAVETLGAASEGGIEDLERRVREIFEKKEEIAPQAQVHNTSINMPEDCYLLDELPSSNSVRRAALEYLRSRRLDDSGLLVCTRGRYRNRIIIPYRDKSGALVYYNARYIGDAGSNLRYLGPPKELGVGKGDVLFVPRWPAEGSKIYITEGEFDAMSLAQAGFNSAALGGKAMTQKQMTMLSDFSPVLCLDADSAGGGATASIAKTMMGHGVKGIKYVRPCVQHKDWNGLLVAGGPRILSRYIEMHEKDYDSSGEWESTRLKMNEIVR